HNRECSSLFNRRKPGSELHGNGSRTRLTLVPFRPVRQGPVRGRNFLLPLLDCMREFMAQKPATGNGSRVVLTAREHHIATYGIRQGIDRSRRFRGLCVCMDTHAAEIVTEPRGKEITDWRG